MGPECKPIITVAGETRIFESLEAGLKSSLASEAVEWKRIHGRATKIVYVNASFTPFNPEALQQGAHPSEALLTYPILHTYWIECPTVEIYKQSVKEGINSWLSSLKRCGVSSDWLIILLEPQDSRKSSKLLPRNSVLDKIKNDVGEKLKERCISLMDPSKTDSRQAESWKNLLFTMRTKVLVAYNSVLGRFEDNMRKQREMRNHQGWNFCTYFILQEELAFVYEMLGVFDESLVQYDELDALFTQFILNTNVGETPNWLKGLTGEFNDWSGLSLNIAVNHDLRKLIQEAKPSVLDIRNYLFSRQCAMLLLMNKPWEVAKRSLDFLHNCVQELELLEIPCPEGSIASWVLLSCLEILSICHNEANSLYTASLWNYARQKLKELGKLCGLFPKSEITSEKLHMVVQISSGIRDSHYLQSSQPPRANPVDKLKEALSSKEAFRKYYLELSELAISTYKHINRIRSARLVGLDLALFYIEADQANLASTFLQDALKSYNSEGWDLSSKETQVKLIQCYGPDTEPQRYIRSCALIASSEASTKEERELYFNQLMDFAKSKSSSGLVADAEGIFNVLSAEVKYKPKIIFGTTLELELEFDNTFDADIHAEEISVILNYSDSGALKERSKVVKSYSSVSAYPSKNRNSVCRSSSTVSSLKNAPLSVVNDEEAEIESKGVKGSLEIRQELDCNQDQTFNSVRLVCDNTNRVLRRKDSSGYILRDGCSVEKNASEYKFSKSSVDIKRGRNKIILSTQVGSKIGTYSCKQLSVVIVGGLEFVSDITENEYFTSIHEEPEVTLIPASRLLIGVEQPINLVINCKSAFWGENNFVSIDCSSNLSLRKPDSSERNSNIKLPLPSSNPYDVLKIPLLLLSTNENLMPIQHQITLTTGKSSTDEGKEIHFGSKSFSFQFDPPFTVSSISIKTAITRKFICLSLIGTEKAIDIQQINCEPDNGGVELKALQPNSPFMIDSHTPCNYIWELLQAEDPTKLKGDITFHFKPTDESDLMESRQLKTNLELSNLKTLYLVNSRLDPNEGEFIQASSTCVLVVAIEQTFSDNNSDVSIMYEVLVEQGEWAVCSEETGVLTMDANAKQSFTVEVMPLISGHLTIPHIRLSKYIPPDVGCSETDIKNAQPRRESFSDGEVYNFNRFDQVQVFMPPSTNPNNLIAQ